jgi:DNA-binding transcriptional ArsR family regulator
MGLDPAARLFHALGNSARVCMLLELTRLGEADASALAGAAGCHPSPASNHLRLLRHAGVVERRAEGRRRLYRLASEEARYILEVVC